MKKQGKILFLTLSLSFFFCIPFSSFCASKITSSQIIQENIFLAQSGDYTVLSKGSQRAFILIKSTSPKVVWLEIIHFPCIIYKERALIEKVSWKTAVHELKSPSKVFVVSLSSDGTHLFSLNTRTQNLEPIVSSNEVPFFSQIFKLRLSPAPLHLIKVEGKGNKSWFPKVSFEGAPPIPVPADAWHGFWPKDGGSLSETSILMYFATPNISPFPLWANIETPKGNTIIRALDVGHGATSPYLYSIPDCKID
ncbi:hypothetical protein C10C_0091 [Chlamydia serpentis]|uniref:Lipoprotein n=1 Tax=Chlamydia serpentis TaxID=1967782 RepID=A0A2R8FAJ4_9CHLA|nr:hypothetical protein [Chlamydia serpentis]SPN73277.1 hypothetical protein C10C_0091 [Chlamydia serpentis]